MAGRSRQVDRLNSEAWPGRAPGVVVVQFDEDPDWLDRLRRASAVPVAFQTWERAVTGSLGRPRGELTLLDSGVACAPAELVSCTRSLGLLNPVVVSIRRDGAAVCALLDAGAFNVLDRDESPGVLAARVGADLRWLRRSGWPAAADAGPATVAPSYRTQALLLKVLCSLRGPVCCHDIRRLLGTPSSPMSLPALRARIRRLTPYLASKGLTCRRSGRWGADTISVHHFEGAAGRAA
ncbi:hypothetical protein ACFWVU_00235 [Streptomyces sp. NPDC058686]|uniref:hypothetical protein n=1 Tax=Streptomyces sp. NPDC058686 TaxID=3346599 RepID=UPI00365C080A